MDLGLSILIPVYNWNVNTFVRELHRQALGLNIPFEIRVYNDASPIDIRPDFLKLNHICYTDLPQNIGRSKIRNLLAEDASFPILLFLDGDSFPKYSNFLKNYISSVSSENTIVCGGTAYEDLKNDHQKKLRWVYGKSREENHSGKGFTSNNFLIYRSSFLNQKFNEEIIGYGHEDTLFGIEWVKSKNEIRYCNAPLLHLGLEEDLQFVEKTKTAVANLKNLYNKGLITANENRLIKFHEKLYFKTLFKFSIKILTPLLMYLVIKKHHLKSLDLLKWYWFISE